MIIISGININIDYNFVAGFSINDSRLCTQVENHLYLASRQQQFQLGFSQISYILQFPIHTTIHIKRIADKTDNNYYNIKIRKITSSFKLEFKLGIQKKTKLMKLSASQIGQKCSIYKRYRPVLGAEAV